MKIFLTGGSGMVGQNILEHLKAKTHEIYSPASQELNLLDRDAVKRQLETFEPDIVIHSAGRVGGIQANIANPVDFLMKNLDMGLNVISAAASVGVPDLINFGSSCMYPRAAENPLKEDFILKGELEPTNEGYALAKIVSAKLFEYIISEDPSKNYKTIIPCNLYGRYDKYEPRHSHLIPAVIRKIYEAKQAGDKVVTIWGDGTARREFMCVKDLANFVFFAISRINEMPQNLNIGLGYDYSVKDYYTTIASVLGYNGSFDYDLSKPVGMNRKLVDIQQLQSFGWAHKTTLSHGVREAFDFYKQGLENEI